jgi:hypothetical protein
LKDDIIRVLCGVGGKRDVEVLLHPATDVDKVVGYVVCTLGWRHFRFECGIVQLLSEEMESTRDRSVVITVEDTRDVSQLYVVVTECVIVRYMCVGML